MKALKVPFGWLGASRRANDQSPPRSLVRIAEIGGSFETGPPLVAIAVETSAVPSVLLSATQNELGSFLADLGSLKCLSACSFLRGLRDALAGDLYDAGDAFFNWIEIGDAGFTTQIYIDELPTEPDPYRLRYPAFSVTKDAPAEGRLGAKQRATRLFDVLKAYDAADGNDAARFRLLEGIALGLAKHFGGIGDDGAALDAIGTALKHNGKSIHLRAAQFALQCRLEGRPVPDRLVKFIGPDNGALLGRICPQPFKRFDITETGDVHACCGHWLPTPIGNILNQEINDVLNSETARKIRASMLDGTYKYCNHLDCADMIRDELPMKEDVTDPVLRAALDDGELKVAKVDDILFAFDQTCNLSCPSCRVERIVERQSLNEAKTKAIEEKLVPLLPHLKSLYLNVAGEVFASKSSRRLLELVNRETSPDLRIDIISNGMLFTEKEWNHFSNIHGMIGSIRISTDAATKPTFEKLRRLGVWETFIENMTALGRIRKEGGFPNFYLSFTYQVDNFREMTEFVDFAKGLGCDFVQFERLQKLGSYTWDEYNERAVHLSSHPLHGEFLQIVNKLYTDDRLTINHDFEWQGSAVEYQSLDLPKRS